ncbi:hypothetical protein BC939DRAFT_441004 [Gamsiella multidivaricata]|uniref:uncharacterized protein n=1 Tax=Gamsiella multidivaricata TaxID=101098 RepID=UPI0022209813|nr:uncharacterized protein BC939DRAFT_441004 [Gamsiella multidivaricata]KAI7829534.1 hypothetical protein BC939DRAFT_441004 [Gamsiella multidivaricata]
MQLASCAISLFVLHFDACFDSIILPLVYLSTPTVRLQQACPPEVYTMKRHKEPNKHASMQVCKPARMRRESVFSFTLSQHALLMFFS